MAAGLNKVCFIGHLVRDPEVKYTPGGVAIAKLSIAVQERKKDKTGNYSDHPIYLDVDVWDKLAERVGKFLKRGSMVAVDGRFTMDSWEDKKTHAPRTKLKIIASEIQFLNTPGMGVSSGTASSEDQRPAVEIEDISQDPADYGQGEL